MRGKVSKYLREKTFVGVNKACGVGENRNINTERKISKTMEKKVKFSDNPKASRIVYGIVIAILCITAIVVGIVAAASKDKGTLPDDSSGVGEGDNAGGENSGNENEPAGDEDADTEPDELCFVSPVVGTVSATHSTDAPVFSTTLGEWRVHTGIDIVTDEDVPVYAAEDGVVSEVRDDPMLGHTVVISHRDGIKTVYSNLKKDETVVIAVGDEVKSGDRIGTVGDTTVSEIAEEPHLHFEITVNDVAVDPLLYISKESQKASLGIEE